MQWKKMLLALIIGLILFITDMRFGWISVSIGGVWTLFLIIFIVGVIAGDISGGFLAGLLTALLGVGLLALIPEILVPELTISATDLFARMWIVMAASISYSARFPDAPVPWIEALVISILLVLLAPLVYGLAMFFGPVGGLFGRFIHPKIFKPKEAPVHVPSQEPVPTPPAPEPVVPEESPPAEVEEEEPEGVEPEPSE